MVQRYLARQAIVTTNKHIYGYELLYRNSSENFFPSGISSSEATQKLISSIRIDFDPSKISGGYLCFVNFTKEIIMSELILCLEASKFVIEILEDVIIDKEFAERVEFLRKFGYTFAIDDYTGEQNISEVLEFISIIKIDYILTPHKVQEEIIKLYGGEKILIAEKIETKEEFDIAINMGYQLFQGYFFNRPTLIVLDTINVLKTSMLSLLQEAAKENIEYDAITSIIRADAGITYRLLNYINTLQYLSINRVKSVKQALVRMGTIEVRKWITLILIQNTADKNEEETINVALFRGIFAEKISYYIPTKKRKEFGYYAYIAGMFSVFPERQQKEIYTILNFAISDDENKILNELVSMIFSYESADWEKVENFGMKYSIEMDNIFICYNEAIASADGTLNS